MPSRKTASNLAVDCAAVRHLPAMYPEYSCLSPFDRHSIGSLLACEDINKAIRMRYDSLRNDEDLRRTHNLFGRYENVYIDLGRIPEIQPVVTVATHYAKLLLQRKSLKFGFWFNEMPPGTLTSLHTHDELDELLSCVYYVSAASDSGRLLLHLDDETLTIKPRPGLFVLFPPDVPHEVEINRSAEIRLSVAFNFGPPSG